MRKRDLIRLVTILGLKPEGNESVDELQETVMYVVEAVEQKRIKIVYPNHL